MLRVQDPVKILRRKMKKEWFFDRFCGVQVAVYAEDGNIVELAVENEREGNVLGSIYKGRVANVVAGMQAAFVSCGLEKNCYLPLNERAARFASYDGDGKSAGRTLREGDEILVQVEKLPRGSKGAKVTCDLSFVGKHLIFLPTTDFLGISRKITDEETRARLLANADRLRGEGQGFIVRTAAENATPRRLKAEAEYLKKVYREVLEAAKTAPVGSAVYREYDLPVKILRDSPVGDADKLYVREKSVYEKAARFARAHPGFSAKKIVHYTGQRNMYAEYGLSEQIYELTRPAVPLPSGGYLVIDRTEAMTVIDVNTGRYVGESDLESTVFETNLQAAREIARQVRLRNLGGIVTVDFIDMTASEHCEAVNAALAEALASDRAKCRVFPMNELCVTIFTRKRTSNDLSTFLLQPCPHCTRQGFVLSAMYTAMRLHGEITDRFADGYRAAIVELNRDVMQAILSERYFHEDVLGDWREKRVYMIPHADWQEEKFSVRGDNAGVLTLPDNAQILY